MARDNAIQLAVSNPCFELWLLLHFRDSPGVRDVNALEKLLEKSVPNYNKSVDFARYRGGYDDAVKRSRALDRLAAAAKSPGMNPSTGVYKLTEMIRGS